jgi:hypothetical protein
MLAHLSQYGSDRQTAGPPAGTLMRAGRGTRIAFLSLAAVAGIGSGQGGEPDDDR